MRLALGLVIAAASLFAVAEASAESDCKGYGVVAIHPTDGQVDVPIDVVPHVIVAEVQMCDDDYQFPELTLDRDGEDLPGPQHQHDGYTLINDLVLDAPLEPNTRYRFVVHGDGFEGPVSESVTFTTGSGNATPIEAPPEIEIFSAYYDGSEEPFADGRAYHLVSFRVTPTTPDPDNLSLIRIEGDDKFVYASFVIGGDPIESSTYVYQRPDEELCLTAVQVNAAGDEQSQRVCVTPEADPNGCQAAVGSPRGAPLSLAGFAVALSLVVLRRGRGSSRDAVELSPNGENLAASFGWRVRISSAES